MRAPRREGNNVSNNNNVIFHGRKVIQRLKPTLEDRERSGRLALFMRTLADVMSSLLRGLKRQQTLAPVTRTPLEAI